MKGILQKRGCVRLAGEQVVPFLQGLVTTNVEELVESGTGVSALLTPQGKVLFLFFIYARSQTELIVDLPRQSVATFIERLRFYRLRRDIEIENADSLWHVYVDTQETSAKNADPRWHKLGARYLVDTNEPKAAEPAVDVDYEAFCLKNTIADLHQDFESECVFPHDIGMDRLHGVDFAKGCYVGQEVISRMHHRGAIRRRVMGVTLESFAKPPHKGSNVYVGDKKLGVLGSVAQKHSLFIVRTDRLSDALKAKTPIMVNDTQVIIHLPPWAGEQYY